jgi:branched-chain amino acid aminotransferase
MQYRGKYLIRKNELLSCAGFDFDARPIRQSVYEVIRLMDGAPLFFEKHIQRMYRSVKLAGEQPFFGTDNIKEMINTLSSANKIETGNVKLVFPLNQSKERNELIAFFIPHSYPTPEMYRDGIEMMSLRAGRPNPNAKITNPSLRRKANQRIADNNIYEVLLINEQELITEGSRSNIFFIRDDRIITPPEDLVLPGITRNYVIEICHNHQIALTERKIHYAELSSFSAAFITGTSPKVLPVRRIDGVNFDPGHQLMRRIMKSYDARMEEYVAKAKISCHPK